MGAKQFSKIKMRRQKDLNDINNMHEIKFRARDKKWENGTTLLFNN